MIFIGRANHSSAVFFYRPQDTVKSDPVHPAGFGGYREAVSLLQLSLVIVHKCDHEMAGGNGRFDENTALVRVRDPAAGFDGIVDGVAKDGADVHIIDKGSGGENKWIRAL